MTFPCHLAPKQMWTAAVLRPIRVSALLNPVRALIGPADSHPVLGVSIHLTVQMDTG